MQPDRRVAYKALLTQYPHYTQWCSVFECGACSAGRRDPAPLPCRHTPSLIASPRDAEEDEDMKDN